MSPLNTAQLSRLQLPPPPSPPSLLDVAIPNFTALVFWHFPNTGTRPLKWSDCLYLWSVSYNWRSDLCRPWHRKTGGKKVGSITLGTQKRRHSYLLWPTSAVPWHSHQTSNIVVPLLPVSSSLVHPSRETPVRRTVLRRPLLQPLSVTRSSDLKLFISTVLTFSRY